MSDKIPLAIIGCGIIGESHIRGYVDNPLVEVAAICDIDEARLDFIGDKYGITRRFTHIGRLLLEAISMRSMSASHNLHRRSDRKRVWGTSTARSRWWHLCRRVNMEEAPSAGRPYIQLGLSQRREGARRHRCYRPGRLYHMRLRLPAPAYVDGYATKEFVNMTTAGGGALFDMGVYHISQLLYLTGVPKLERVTGQTYAEIAMDEERRKISGFNVEELGCGFAFYENGLTMDILESWAIHARPFPSSILCGSLGGITLSPLTLHTREQDMESDLAVDLKAMNYLDHTVYADAAFYDNSQQHWAHVLAGTAPRLKRRIALETQKVQEASSWPPSWDARDRRGDRRPSVSRALEIPNLASD